MSKGTRPTGALGAGLLALSWGCTEPSTPSATDLPKSAGTAGQSSEVAPRPAPSAGRRRVGAASRKRARVLEVASAALARWEAKGPASYTFVAETDCFCDLVGSVRIVVEQGRVVSAVALKTGLPHLASREQTMTRLLEMVREWARDEHDVFDAKYAALGYLEQLERDGYLDRYDDEFLMTVTCFSPSTSDRACPGGSQ